jgi:RNA polymerase-interacting CarD/CdnL/TRCF family regulator
MDLNQIDEETEQKLTEISQEDEFEEHTAMLVRALYKIKKERNLSDEEAELLSYILINKLSSEMANYLSGYVEIDD